MWAGQQRTPDTGEDHGGRRLRGSQPLCPRRPRGRPAAYPWRGCRGKAGHHPCRPAHDERGKRPDAALPAVRPARRRAGPPSADGIRAWRSPRSTRRPGEPAAWRRGAASSQAWDWQARRSPVKPGAPQPTPSLQEAQARVLGIQTKLHQWATGNPSHRFDDLFNLVRSAGRRWTWHSALSMPPPWGVRSAHDGWRCGDRTGWRSARPLPRRCCGWPGRPPTGDGAGRPRSAGDRLARVGGHRGGGGRHRRLCLAGGRAPHARSPVDGDDDAGDVGAAPRLSGRSRDAGRGGPVPSAGRTERLVRP
jgi:hypothetical protein